MKKKTQMYEHVCRAYVIVESTSKTEAAYDKGIFF